MENNLSLNLQLKKYKDFYNQLKQQKKDNIFYEKILQKQERRIKQLEKKIEEQKKQKIKMELKWIKRYIVQNETRINLLKKNQGNYSAISQLEKNNSGLYKKYNNLKKQI